MDEDIAQITSICSTEPERAQQYLTLADGNVEQAIQLFFDYGGADMAASVPTPHADPPLAEQRSRPSRPSRTYVEDEDGVVHLDSDEEMSDVDGDEAAVRQAQNVTPPQRPAIAGGQTGAGIEDDEAMARRLQEEMYGGGGAGDGFGEVRAPMARTAETLVGPNADWRNDPNEMRAAVMEQMAARQRRGGPGRPGIFNQRSVWDSEDTTSPEAYRRRLAMATGGASEASSKSNHLAELFRPPVELMSTLSWQDARDEGKESEKWILVNVQDPSIFDCQRLNRDIWKDAQVKETVRENFIFMQYLKNDPKGEPYMNYYFHNRDSEAAYPHIAIVDPRTGEQVKVWSGSPVPTAAEFVQDLHEFLDRYSLKAFAKNPVANRKPEKRQKDPSAMTEEEMLEMALQNSLANGAGPKEDDPDALTKGAASGKGKEKAAVDRDAMATTTTTTTDTAPPQPNGSTDPPPATPFSLISSTNPHTEPAPGPATTRIQFRSSGSRRIRRFGLSERVRRVYEWLKAEPWEEGMQAVEFELIFMGRNLIDSLDLTVEQAGLKNGSVMVEFLRE
ncbi:UBX domain protein Ubx2 [Elasticomyces elasticus]|nr:UBX domain protein Ubx2 [Elasticomyces elasticus]